MLSSCVTPKVHNALITEVEKTKSALKHAEKRVIALSEESKENYMKILRLKKQIRP